jgi:hypothetical protein
MEIYGDLNLHGGKLVDTKMESFATLPVFVVGEDEGKIVFVSTGADAGYWLGAADGSASYSKLNLGTTLVSYGTGPKVIADGATYTNTVVSSSSVAASKGIFTKVVLASSLGSGKVLVELFNDAGYTDRVYANYFDLASGSLTDRLPASFEVDNADGDIYVIITNLTGSSGTFTLTVQAAGVLLAAVPSPPGAGSGVHAGVAGDGIAYDAINAWLEVDLATNPGLELSGAPGAAKLKVLPAPAGGLSLSAAGLAVDSTIALLSGDQSIAGKKTFTGGTIGLTPQAIATAPVAGTWVRGTFYVDSADDVWYCTVGGTPGTWKFWGWRLTTQGGALAGTSYTGAIAPGASENLSITLKGRRGIIRKMNIWGSNSTFAATDVDTPYRISCYPSELYEGRGQIWTVMGQLRKGYINDVAGVPVGTAVVPMSTVNIGEPDDLLRLRKAVGPLEEYGRITVRTTAPATSYTIDENTVNAYAQNDVVMLVTEFVELPWWNDSAVPANYTKLYLRFCNDDAVATVKLGYELYVEEIGGGQSF